MPTKSAESMLQAEKILVLFKEASATLNERRKEQRHPFFQPVTIQLLELNDIEIEAFCKDISLGGMSLFSNLPVPSMRVRLNLKDKFGAPIQLLGKVIHSEDCGRGWYTSGIQFCQS